MQTRLQEEKVLSLIASQTNTQKKPWAEMNPTERKARIRKLWNKVRMFIRVRRSVVSVR